MTKPSSASPTTAAKKREPAITIEWTMQDIPQDGFLSKMGTGLEENVGGLGVSPHHRYPYVRGGQSQLTKSEIFRYIRHGATYYEAARLNEFKKISKWEKDEDFQRASAKCHTKFEKTLGLIESKKLSQASGLKVIQNGLTDALLESSTLTADQTVSVFKRFKYTHNNAYPTTNVVSKPSKEAPAMMDAMLAGKLPYDIFEEGYDKQSILKVWADIYGEPGENPEFTESEREEIRSNLAVVKLLLELMDHHQPRKYDSEKFRSIGLTYRALREHGEEAVRNVHPETLMVPLRNGSTMGPEGAATVATFIRYVESSDIFEDIDITTTGIHASGGGAGFSLTYTNLVALIDAGINDSGIVQLLFTRGMTVDEALDYTKETPSLLLIEGEL